MSTMLASPLSALNNSFSSMDSSCLEHHQYAEWQEWSTRARRSESDLMDDIVDEAAERHLYIPLKQAAATPSLSPDLGDEELVMRVVQFFSNIHANTALRQLGIYEGHPNQPYRYTTNFPQHNNAFCSSLNDSFTFTTDAEDVSLTELGLTPSLIAEQEQIWNQAKKHQQQTPIIPDWLHDAARQDGRRIRVVMIDTNTETKTVRCIGCCKDMLAAASVEIVFCPECGVTFSPNMLSPPCREESRE